LAPHRRQSDAITKTCFRLTPLQGRVRVPLSVQDARGRPRQLPAIYVMFIANLRRGNFVVADMPASSPGWDSRGPGGRYANYRGGRKYDPAGRFPDAKSLGRALRDCACAGDWDEERAARWWRDTDRSAPPWWAGILPCSTGGRPNTGNSLGLEQIPVGFTG
jgi:hypothetical protein